jgi:hypothetical protein
MSAFDFIDPNFDNITTLFAYVVRFAQTSSLRFVVISQFGNHIEWFDVLRVVIELAPRWGQSERKSCSTYQDSSGSRGGASIGL